MTYAMVIDLKKCVGCYGCHSACKEANGTPPGMFRAWVETVDEGAYPNVRRTFLPKLCMHCTNARCLEACPTGATYRDEDTGLVRINKEECIGCQSCMNACPYGARSIREGEEGYFGAELNPFEQGAYQGMPVNTVDKCDFCTGNGRRDAGKKPACVQACHAQARYFGTVEELQDMIDSGAAYRLLEEEGTEPNVWYLPNKWY